MSVFSVMKKGRQQAKEHNAKESEKARDKNAKTSYKHIPTHAAADAMAGAPPSWQHEYRSQIKEQTRRRSTTGAHERYSTANIPRVSSSLSNVSYPSVYASPIVPVSRVQSFSSLPPAWQYRSKNDFSNQPSSRKGKERDFVPSVPPLPPMPSALTGSRLGTSRKSSKGISRGENSGNSSSSEDDLEMRHLRLVSFSTDTAEGPRSIYGTSQLSATGNVSSQHLRPAHQRKVSTQSDRAYPPSSRTHRFTAPRPMDHKALGIHARVPSPLAPPSLLNEPVASSPSVSNPVSYASSTVSEGSTATSSAVSTPAASIIAAFPSVEKLSSLTKDPLEQSGSPHATRVSSVETIRRGENAREKASSALKASYSTTSTTKTSSVFSVEKIDRPGTALEVKPMETKRKRWSFLIGKRPAVMAA